MKRSLVFSICLIGISLTSYGQLRVNSDGSIEMATSTSAKDMVSMGTPANYSFYNSSRLTAIANSTPAYGTRIAIFGNANVSATSYASNVGVLGWTGQSSGTDTNYGVWGRIASNTKGSAIMGSCDNIGGLPIYGTYAGYFRGPVYVYGTLTASSVVSPSDENLKENISALESGDGSEGRALEKVLEMNVIKYNLKPLASDNNFIDKLDENEKKEEKAEPILHFGLLAQELQGIYPNLVVKGQDGNLGINYVELVPVLIRSIQELKDELDSLKAGSNTIMTAPQRKTTTETSLIDKSSNASGLKHQNPKLYQNTPNPFTERTEIRFTLPDDARNAYIYIFDMQGKMLRQTPVDASMQGLTIDGYEFPAGIYLYSLVVNGQEIDTKRMILSK